MTVAVIVMVASIYAGELERNGIIKSRQLYWSSALPLYYLLNEFVFHHVSILENTRVLCYWYTTILYDVYASRISDMFDKNH